MRKFFCVAAYVFITSCQSSGLSAGIGPSGRLDEARLSGCPQVRGWQEVDRHSRTRILLFGELHGSNELPGFFTSYLCNVASTGAPLVVGIETWGEDEEPLRYGMTLTDDGRYWFENLSLFNSRKDGRNSRAMLDMLIGIRSMRQDGIDIRIVPVAPSIGEIKGYEGVVVGDINSQRFAAEAAILKKLRADAPDSARVIVYHGNLHAMRVGRQVSDASPLFDQSQFVRFNFVTNGGFAWNCQASCGPNPVGKASREIDRIEETGLDIKIEPSYAPPFDGWYYVESLTPSSPADFD